MLEFDCHYVNEMWLTAKYFEFVEDFFYTANSSRDAEDCEPPPCPTSTKTTVTTTTTTATTSAQHSTNGEAHVITSLKSLAKAWSTHCRVLSVIFNEAIEKPQNVVCGRPPICN